MSSKYVVDDTFQNPAKDVMPHPIASHTISLEDAGGISPSRGRLCCLLGIGRAGRGCRSFRLRRRLGGFGPLDLGFRLFVLTSLDAFRQLFDVTGVQFVPGVFPVIEPFDRAKHAAQVFAGYAELGSHFFCSQTCVFHVNLHIFKEFPLGAGQFVLTCIGYQNTCIMSRKIQPKLARIRSGMYMTIGQTYTCTLGQQIKGKRSSPDVRAEHFTKGFRFLSASNEPRKIRASKVIVARSGEPERSVLVAGAANNNGDFTSSRRSYVSS